MSHEKKHLHCTSDQQFVLLQCGIHFVLPSYAHCCFVLADEVVNNTIKNVVTQHTMTHQQLFAHVPSLSAYDITQLILEAYEEME